MHSLADWQSPPIEVHGEHHGTRLTAVDVSGDEDALMNVYAIEHLLISFRTFPEAVYSMPLASGCMHRLVDLLAAKGLISEWDDLDLKQFCPTWRYWGCHPS